MRVVSRMEREVGLLAVFDYIWEIACWAAGWDDEVAIGVEERAKGRISEGGEAAFGCWALVRWEGGFEGLVPGDETYVVEGVHYGSFEMGEHLVVVIVLSRRKHVVPKTWGETTRTHRI
jgi:hypothetical protein